MKASSLFASLILVVLLLFTSCASSKTMNVEASTSPIINAHEQSQKYNMQLDFMKHHLSGMLIVRRLPDDEIRILATTYFGLSLFDFSLQGDEFRVNSCMEPMKKKKILQLLEADFKNLFLNQKNVRIKKKNDTSEERVTGRGFGKSVFHLSEFVTERPEQIRIRHPWLRLSIQLDKLNENK